MTFDAGDGVMKSVTYHYLKPELIVNRLKSEGLESRLYHTGEIENPNAATFPMKGFQDGTRFKSMMNWKRFLHKDPLHQIFWLSTFIDGGAVNKHQRSESMYMLYDTVTKAGDLAMFIPGDWDSSEEDGLSDDEVDSEDGKLKR